MDIGIASGSRALQAAAAVAPALGCPRQPLPHRRTLANERKVDWLRWTLAVLGALAALAVAMPAVAGVAGFAAMVATAVAGLVLSLHAKSRARAGNPVLVGVAALLGAVLIAAWLAGDTAGPRVLLGVPWLVLALLLHRGVGERVPRALLWWPALLTLAAVLLWGVLLLTIESRPATGTQWNVFAGWPWPHYLGSVRGSTPFAARDATALAADYAVTLVVAALVLWRCPSPWLVRWLPRLASALAVLHLVGGYRLAFATDG